MADDEKAQNETEAIGHSYEATTSPSSCTELSFLLNYLRRENDSRGKKE